MSSSQLLSVIAQWAYGQCGQSEKEWRVCMGFVMYISTHQRWLGTDY